jgi:hypothetical protein
MTRIQDSAQKSGQRIPTDIMLPAMQEVVEDFADLLKEQQIADFDEDQMTQVWMKTVDTYQQMEKEAGLDDPESAQNDLQSLKQAQAEGQTRRRGIMGGLAQRIAGGAAVGFGDALIANGKSLREAKRTKMKEELTRDLQSELIESRESEGLLNRELKAKLSEDENKSRAELQKELLNTRVELEKSRNKTRKDIAAAGNKTRSDIAGAGNKSREGIASAGNTSREGIAVGRKNTAERGQDLSAEAAAARDKTANRGLLQDRSKFTEGEIAKDARLDKKIESAEKIAGIKATRSTGVSAAEKRDFDMLTKLNTEADDNGLETVNWAAVAEGMEAKGHKTMAAQARKRGKEDAELSAQTQAEEQADAEVNEKAGTFTGDGSDFKEDGGSRTRFRARRVREIKAEILGKSKPEEKRSAAAPSKPKAPKKASGKVPAGFPKDAQQANDGKWYVKRNGKWNEVSAASN